MSKRHVAATNQQDYRLFQELFYAFQSVPFWQVAKLMAGCAYLGFHQANEPAAQDRAFWANLPTTATWAGGETVSLV